MWWQWTVAAVVGWCSGAGSGRELDPARCAARFDVQRDKIIRAEESRATGGRYLAELDVGALAECRRLCCETDACDVFVLEEQSPGSCYLFACGPPEDFRCKFTRHGNFSSGVMALSRRLAELQDMEPAPTAPPPTITTTVTTPPPPPPQTAPRPPAPTATAASRCSRYQFACHSGGECIAVYNACDGVPQCADGSDEAPELRCPTAPPPLPPRRAPVQPAQRWPHRLTQAQADTPRDDEGPTRIFSHTGGLMQTGAADVTRRRPHVPPPPAAPPAHPPQPYSYGDELAEGVGPRPVAGEWGGAGQWGPRWGQPVGDEAPPPPSMPELPPHDSPKKGPPPQGPAPAAAAPAAVAATTPAPPPVTAPSTTRAPPPPPTHATPPPQHNNIHEKLLAETAARGQHEEEGAAPAPASAALLLVLGVGVSVAACVVASRGVRRRRRRGARAPHDADYLVNGMYL